MKNNFIHESTFIDENVEIGSDTRIWHFCHIQNNTSIGDRVVMGQNVNTG